MADRSSTAGPDGLGGVLVDMARQIKDLQTEVTKLQRTTGSPGADFLWVAEGGTLKVRRISTGGTAVVAGPL